MARASPAGSMPIPMGYQPGRRERIRYLSARTRPVGGARSWALREQARYSHRPSSWHGPITNTSSLAPPARLSAAIPGDVADIPSAKAEQESGPSRCGNAKRTRCSVKLFTESRILRRDIVGLDSNDPSRR